MIIKLCHSDPGQGCKVQLGKWQVPFYDEAQAIAFVRLLQQRINTPHRLPQVFYPLSLAELGDSTAVEKKTAVGV